MNTDTLPALATGEFLARKYASGTAHITYRTGGGYGTAWGICGARLGSAVDRPAERTLPALTLCPKCRKEAKARA